MRIRDILGGVPATERPEPETDEEIDRHNVAFLKPPPTSSVTKAIEEAMFMRIRIAQLEIERDTQYRRISEINSKIEQCKNALLDQADAINMFLASNVGLTVTLSDELKHFLSEQQPPTRSKPPPLDVVVRRPPDPRPVDEMTVIDRSQT